MYIYPKKVQKRKPMRNPICFFFFFGTLFVSEISRSRDNITTRKIKFYIKDFFNKYNLIRRKLGVYCGLVTFTEEMLNGKIHFWAVHEPEIAHVDKMMISDH